ncbi:MAG: ATP-binding protein [Peptoniphilus sp. oral taxon 375]|nr:ATP-binding protein [Peptoniphilus sp. oral taxon 375]
MNPNLKRQIQSHYDRIRTRHAQDQDRRQDEVYQKIPLVQEIDTEINKKGFFAVYQSLAGKDAQDLQRELDHLKDMKRDLLVQNGYPEDYLDPHYDCRECKDTGYLENGKRCDCLKQFLAQDLYEMSNMDRMLKRENFQSFNWSVFSKTIQPDQGVSPYENMKLVVQKVDQFLQDFPQDNGDNLLFYGGTGLGKTFLSNCIAKALLDENYTVIYQTSFTLIDLLERKKFGRESQADLDLAYQLLFSSDLLILDDLGTELTNQFTNAEIFNIINTRILAGKKILISTNLALHEIKNIYSDRVFSRIVQNFIPLRFIGEDLRYSNL